MDKTQTVMKRRRNGADIDCSVGPIRVGRARRTARGLQGEDAAPAPGQADSEAARDSERLSRIVVVVVVAVVVGAGGGPRPGRGPARQPVCRCLSANVGDGWAALAAVDPGPTRSLCRGGNLNALRRNGSDA